jgi:hypothetical protein
LGRWSGQERPRPLAAAGHRVGSVQSSTNVGEVVDFTRAREAHEMLAGRPHRSGKIVLRIEPN